MYQDQLCAFRCLALHRGHDIKSVDGPAKDLYLEWMEHARSEPNEVTFQDFPDFESLFEVNLEVYRLEEDDFAISIYKSRGHHESFVVHLRFCSVRAHIPVQDLRSSL